MMKLIGVIGGSKGDEKILNIAYHVGKKIAESGIGVVCGGLGGVMEAACKGCREAGGLSVGIIQQDDPAFANPYVDVVIPTGMGIARNILVVRSAAGLIAVDGAYGTLSEIAFALQLKKPVVGIRTWKVSDEIVRAGDPAEAVGILLKMI